MKTDNCCQANLTFSFVKFTEKVWKLDKIFPNFQHNLLEAFDLTNIITCKLCNKCDPHPTHPHPPPPTPKISMIMITCKQIYYVLHFISSCSKFVKYFCSVKKNKLRFWRVWNIKSSKSKKNFIHQRYQFNDQFNDFDDEMLKIFTQTKTSEHEICKAIDIMQKNWLG